MDTAGGGSSRLGLRVAAILVPSVALNWLSSLFEPTALIVLVGVAVAVVLVLISESSGASRRIERVTHLSADEIRFGLVSLVSGAIVAVLWLLPWGASRRFLPPSFVVETGAALGIPGSGFYNYEFFAALTLALVAAFAHFRRPNLTRVVVFMVASATGMALVMQSVKPADGHSVWLTVLSWASLGVLIALVVRSVPAGIRVFGEFLGFEPHRRGVAPRPYSGPEREVRSRRRPTNAHRGRRAEVHED